MNIRLYLVKMILLDLLPKTELILSDREVSLGCYFFSSDSENSDSYDSNDNSVKFLIRMESLCLQTNVEICEY